MFDAPASTPFRVKPRSPSRTRENKSTLAEGLSSSKRRQNVAVVAKFLSLKKMNMADRRDRAWCTGWSLAWVKYAASSATRLGSSLISFLASSRRIATLYSLQQQKCEWLLHLYQRYLAYPNGLVLWSGKDWYWDQATEIKQQARKHKAYSLQPTV